MANGANGVGQIIEKLLETLESNAQKVCTTRCKYWAEVANGKDVPDSFYDKHCLKCPLWKMF